MMSTAEYLTNMFGLDGLTSVVVGGTGVLGGAFSDCLGSAGAHVIVAGRNAENGNAAVNRITKAGGSAEFFAIDVTEKDDFQKLADHLDQSNRKLDVLINGAGINSATPFLEITDEEWDQILSINLRSVRLGCQVLGGYMLEKKTKGSIINIASLSGITALSRVFTYAATKAAVINLTQNLAREWATAGIRVNALSPGFFPAEQNRKVLTPDRIESIMRHTPMDRFGDPEELAGAILLMAAPKAGSFLTGANIVIDGGFTGMTI